MLLATQYDVGLDPIQQGEVGFKQSASLDGAKGKGCYQYMELLPTLIPTKEEEKEGN